MNYKKLIKKSLGDTLDSFPDLTVGEIFYSFLRPKVLQSTDTDLSMEYVKWLKDLKDEDIYFALERFSKQENIKYDY